MESVIENSGDYIFEDHITELNFREMEAGQTIGIETLNSSYRFLLIDPANGKGLLSGGSLGEGRHLAFLTGSIGDKRDPLGIDSRRLRTGARALFYLETNQGTKSLTLSKIVRLFVFEETQHGFIF
ncbi:MAG: hypothetical protein AB1631_11270 [Acidobacteriota bacterium]